MAKLILGLVGEIASGKGTVAKYAETKYKGSIHRFSTPLRDVLERMYLEIDRKNMQALSKNLRATFGQDLLAKIITKDAQNDQSDVVIIDGIRRFEDILYLKELPNFHMVYVTADMQTRYERLVKRGENDDDSGKTYEQFVKDHDAEPELQIPKLGQIADLRIENKGSMEELYKIIDDYIEKYAK